MQIDLKVKTYRSGVLDAGHQGTEKYRLEHFRNGQFLPDRTHYSDDKADAILTLQAEALLYEAAGYKRQPTRDKMTLTLLKQ